MSFSALHFCHKTPGATGLHNPSLGQVKSVLRMRCGQFPAFLPVCLGLLTVFGCQSVPSFAPVDLKAPDWKIRQGQAVWRQNRSSPEIAGEVLVATKPDGQAFIQFTKTPFPLINAQISDGKWQVEISMQNRRFSGKGRPPKRLIWLRLPSLLAGDKPPAGWSWQFENTKEWRLENRSSGELIEGYFNQ